MAATTFSPGGFSYAQAAKGRSSAATSQTPSSKVTSGTASPATGVFSELTPSSNWADDVESDVKAKEPKESKDEVQTVEAVQAVVTEKSKSTEDREAAEAPAPIAETQQPEGLAESSPDMTASTSTTFKEEETGSSAPNASGSDSTWESKSSASSEPSWIADRTARQNNAQQVGAQNGEKESKKEKKSKETAAPAPAPIVLQEAPIPENIWAKRAAVLSQQTKPALSTPKSAVAPKKENQKPVADAQAKSSNLHNGTLSEQPRSNSDEQLKSSSQNTKRTGEVRNSQARNTSRTAVSGPRADGPHNADVKDIPNDRKETAVKSFVPPPPVNDAVSWPTPDSAEKERKEPAEKEKVDKAEEDSTPAAKRKKIGWTPIAVTPTYLFETTGTNKPHERRSHPAANSDGTPRGGPGGRGGRGGLRRANGAERVSRPEPSSSDEKIESAPATNGVSDNTKRDRAAMPPPARPARTASADAFQNRKKDSSPAQMTNGQQNSQLKQQDDTFTDKASAASTANGGFTRTFGDERRSKAQKKTDSETREDATPMPIPQHRGSVPTETNSVENGQRSVRGPPPIRKVPVDSRSDNRSFGDNRDPHFPSPARGGKRHGRGRGGNREFANGHASSSPINGSYGEFSPYTVPQSPSAYQAPRGNNHFSHASPRGSYRGNLRTQSIPIDPYYNPRHASHYGGQQQHPHFQPYWPQMVDMNGFPMSAPPFDMPFSPFGDKNEELRHQIEYYFSEDNLAKDVFLRGQMDSQGFVFLEVVANFNRVKQVTQDKEVIKAVCMTSENIDVRVGEDGRERLRKHRDWEKYVLEMGQRHVSAQNNGPEHLAVPEHPPLALNNIPPQFRGPQSAGMLGRPQFSRQSYDSALPAMDQYTQAFFGYAGYPPEMYGAPMMGEEMRGRTARASVHERMGSQERQEGGLSAPGQMVDTELSVECDVNALTVVVNMGDLRASPHSASARTFSNGSIDSSSTLPEPSTQTTGDFKTLVNGDSHANSTIEDSFSALSSPTKTAAGDDTNKVFWVKEREFPLGNLPPGLSSYPYLQLKEEALQQRTEAVTGTCPAKLSILYQFWCHFLIRNFNTNMYEEFQRLAYEDAHDRYNFAGLHNLVKFYSQSLTNKNHPLRDRVAKDYVQLVNEAPKGMKDAPFKALRTSWRDGDLNLKNRKKLVDVLDPALKKKLDEPHTPAGETSNPLSPS